MMLEVFDEAPQAEYPPEFLAAVEVAAAEARFLLVDEVTDAATRASMLAAMTAPDARFIAAGSRAS